MKLNQYQTPITDELLASLPDEVRDQLLDFINNVPFIQRLISPNRQYAKDRPRDKDGKIIVDICNPHILEDMDYFREAAIHYQQHGCYTFLRPNGNPNSEYGKWIRRERDRCWEGMVRPSDGEWIPGTMYFYLNYCPIILSVAREGTNQADRMVDFPRVWEGIYLRFHYIHQARNGGYYNNWKGALNGAELASRGKSKSYCMASMLAHNFVLGENRKSFKDTRSTITAYQKEFLIKDGTLNKFEAMIDFCAQNTQFPSKRLKNSLDKMNWIMGYTDLETGTKMGTKNEVLGVTSKDNISKLRGKRSVFLGIEEFGCHIKGTKVLMYDGTFKNVEDVQIGDYLMGNDNTPRIVEKLYNGVDQLYKITLSNGDYQIVNSHHPVYFKKFDWNKGIYTEHTLTAPKLLNIKSLNKGYYIPKAIIEFPYTPVPINPYFLGLWLGDGDSTRLDIANKDKEILQWLSDNYVGQIRDLSQSESCKVFHISKTTHVYNRLFLEYNLYNNKHIPENYRVNRSDIQLQVVAGLIDTDGTYNPKKNFFEITQRHDRKHILDNIKFMCECNGLRCSMTSRIGTGKKKGVLHYRLRISGDLSIIPTKIERKKGTINTSYRCRKCWSDYTFKIEPYDTGEYYGFTVDKNHLFVLSDLTITHNTFPNLSDLYTVMRPSVRENNLVFGLMYLQGTAGDKDSDFAGAQEIMYNPNGYDMYALPNVFDKASQGKPYFVFFFPGYMNYAGAYNKDGVSDVTKALVEILLDRYKVKYNSTDPNTIVKTIAEVPITPSEAILKTKHNIFPVTDLLERLGQIDSNPSEFNDVYVGELVLKNGTIELNPTVGTPIREFPHKDNKLDGAVEIFTMPQKIVGEEGVHIIPNGRYIASCDPVDDDSSETTSLQSAFVLDLWTDQIVAEYTGRPQFAEDYYEQLRRLCLFYNARLNYENNKKGIFAYFSKMNSLYLLTDILEYLKDRDMVKGNLYGNKAHPYTQEVWTPDGKKLWGDIRVGDELFSDSGESCQVVEIPFDDITDIYEITLKDGRKVKASENHLWRVLDWNGYERIVSTKDMLTSGYYRNKDIYKEHKYYIPVNGAVEFPKAELPLDPYFLGLMLGDGCFVNSSRNWAYFTSSPSDLEVYKSILKVPCKTLDDRHHKFNIPGVKTVFEKLGLADTRSHSKFIPELYKQTSIKDRLELLRGLMDTDGSVGYGGNPEYVTVSKRLSEDIMWVARSLGMNCTLQTHKNSYGEYYKTVLYTTQGVFHLPRKSEKQRVTKTRAFKIAITDIKFVGTERAKCVTVDAHDQCYLIGDFIVTHNSKGTQATLPINNFARTLIRDWLLKPVAVTTEVDGKQVETKIPNLYRLRQRALIKELAQWNNEGNFDRVSSLGMLMLLREDRMIMYGGDTNRMQTSKAKTLADDPFFSNNYREYRAPDTEELPTYQKTVIG